MSRSAWAKSAPRIGSQFAPSGRTPEEQRAHRAKQQRDRRATNPEAVRATERALPSKQPAMRQAWQRADRAARPEVYRTRERVRALRRYGLTIAQWEAMFDGQGRVCKCCGTSDPGSRRRWATDHDHVTEAIRGILCNYCNTTIGLLGDNADGVRRFAALFLAYLEPA